MRGRVVVWATWVSFVSIISGATNKEDATTCSLSSSKPYAPDPRGTPLPNGEFWGAWDATQVRVRTYVVVDDTTPTGQQQSHLGLDDDGGDSTVVVADVVELVASGFRWTEGPLWSRKRRELLFTDTIANRVYRLTKEEEAKEEDACVTTEVVWGSSSSSSTPPGGGSSSSDGKEERWFEPGPNGLAWADENEDSLLICQHAARRLITVAPSRDFALTHIVAAGGFNSPNDVALAPEGDAAYFTDPPYGCVVAREPDGLFALGTDRGEFADQLYVDELCQVYGARNGAKGVYRVDLSLKDLDDASEASTTPTLITAALRRPNGLGFDAARRLWVADSSIGNSSWTAFDPATGDIVARIPWTGVFDHLVDGPGVADGLAFDQDTGFLWATVPGGVAVFRVGATWDDTSFRLLATVQLGTNTANVAVVGGDSNDVYVTGLGHVWRLERAKPRPTTNAQS